jgi:hypothetical protein
VKRLPRLMPGEAVRGEHLVRHLEGLLEADGPTQAMPADLQEDLVRDVVVRGEEQRGEDLRKGASRLAVNIDRLQALRHGSGRDLALDAAAGPLDEGGDQLAGVFQAYRGVLGQADAAASFGTARPESGVIRVCVSAERTLLPLRTASIVLKFTASAEFRAS